MGHDFGSRAGRLSRALPACGSDRPVVERKNFAELASAIPVPDIAGIDVEDRTVPAEPEVPVRIYRPHQAQGAIVWMHGGGYVMGDLNTEHPWAIRLADSSGVTVISVGYRRLPRIRFRRPSTTFTQR